MRLIFRYILLSVFIAGFGMKSQAESDSSRIGFSRSSPVSYADWSNGFMGGNGKMGIIVFGNPLDETIIFNNRKFFMVASHECSFNQVSPANMKQIRDYCVEENWEAANKLANDEISLKADIEESLLGDIARIINFKKGQSCFG